MSENHCHTCENPTLLTPRYICSVCVAKLRSFDDARVELEQARERIAALEHALSMAVTAACRVLGESSVDTDKAPSGVTT